MPFIVPCMIPDFKGADPRRGHPRGLRTGWHLSAKRATCECLARLCPRNAEFSNASVDLANVHDQSTQAGSTTSW